MEVISINAAGRAALTEWLEANLKAPENAQRHADVVAGEFDGSSDYYELRGYYTRDGNPAIYTFSDAELDREEIAE